MSPFIDKQRICGTLPLGFLQRTHRGHIIRRFRLWRNTLQTGRYKLISPGKAFHIALSQRGNYYN